MDFSMIIMLTNWFSIIIMLTQPFVPTLEGIMKDYYSTDQNQTEVNSFHSLSIIHLDLNHCIKFLWIFPAKIPQLLLEEKTGHLASEYFLVFSLLSVLFLVWYAQHQRESLPGFLEWITCSKEHNSPSNRYNGAEVMWHSNFLYISGFSTTIRTKKSRHADNSGTVRNQDREMGIGIFSYANTWEAWICGIFKDVASLI